MKFIDEDINNYQYMYIISNDKGYIKVGISKNPKRRLKQLQTGNQNKLTLLFTEEFECERDHLLKIEKLVHKDLKSFKSVINVEHSIRNIEYSMVIINNIIFILIVFFLTVVIVLFTSFIGL